MDQLKKRLGENIIMRLAVGISAALFAVAGVSAGEAPEPGWTYRVVDVAGDDQLNVREQPGVGAPVVATLAPDASRIVVSGLRMRVGAGVWWEIHHGATPRSTGWVNARFLAPVDPGVEPDTGFALRCSGTEPFWSLEVDGAQAQFSTPQPDEKLPVWRASSWMNAANMRPGMTFVVRLYGDGQSDPGVAAISRPREPDACTDFMSDFEYPYDATVLTPEGRVLAGCCTRAR